MKLFFSKKVNGIPKFSILYSKLFFVFTKSTTIPEGVFITLIFITLYELYSLFTHIWLLYQVNKYRTYITNFFNPRILVSQVLTFYNFYATTHFLTSITKRRTNKSLKRMTRTSNTITHFTFDDSLHYWNGVKFFKRQMIFTES